VRWVVKRKSRTIGAVYELSNGDLAYLARRWRGEIFCCGEPNISAAMALNKEEWAFDHDHLLELRLKKVKYVGVIERERGGMIYLTTLESGLLYVPELRGARWRHAALRQPPAFHQARRHDDFLNSPRMN
jgi:hypothetical protein